MPVSHKLIRAGLGNSLAGHNAAGKVPHQEYNTRSYNLDLGQKKPLNTDGGFRNGWLPIGGCIAFQEVRDVYIIPFHPQVPKPCINVRCTRPDKRRPSVSLSASRITPDYHQSSVFWSGPRRWLAGLLTGKTTRPTNALTKQLSEAIV